MEPTDFNVRLADWKRDEAALRAVRTTVFVKEQAVAEREEWDGLDPECAHAVAETEADGVIGTGRLHPSGKIGRMAVLAEWRGQGVGAAILRRLLEEAAGRGLASVYLHAQVPVLGFYARFGFVAEGDEFEEANIPHRLMRLRLAQGNATPESSGDNEADDAPTGTRRVLSGKREFAVAVAEVAAVASRSLAIFTPDLEHGVYDSKPFLETVKRLVLSRSHARIRVLVSDPGRVQHGVNRFLHFGRRLSTFVEFRRLPESLQDRSDAFLVADGTALVYRARSDRWEGVADTREPRMARLYLGEFDQMWQLSEHAREIGELRI
jgi:predicted GNAT family N-acyltransferase